MVERIVFAGDDDVVSSGDLSWSCHR
jgi:hypothetical protein